MFNGCHTRNSVDVLADSLEVQLAVDFTVLAYAEACLLVPHAVPQATAVLIMVCVAI